MMTNKGLTILGQGYQLAYEERVENLRWNSKPKIETITIANMWDYFNITQLSECMPNGETHNLLLCLAEDIDKLDDVVRKLPFINDRERFLLLLRELPSLHRKIDLVELSKYLENHYILYTLNWVLEYNVKYFNYVIEEINKQTFDYITKEEWVKNPFSEFDGVTYVEVRKGNLF